jgi:proline iminopeptidase
MADHLPAAFRRNSSLKRRSLVSVALILYLVFGASVGTAGQRPTGGETQSGYLSVNGTRLFYESMGRGTPLLIVHGGPGLDHSYFLPQMRALAARYRLIFFDQRGCGKSDADVDSTTMTVDTFIRDLDGVRRAFHLRRVNLLGHSWGGLVAMRYALVHPENISTLILVAPTPATSAMRDSSFAFMRHNRTPQDSAEQATIMDSPGFKAGSPDAMAKFFRLLFRPLFARAGNADSLTLIFPEDYAKRRSLVTALYRDPTLKAYNLLEGLRQLRCRSLIIDGDHDMVPHAALEQLHHALVGSRIVILRDCGHFPFIEAPEQFAHALRMFLR